MGTVTDGVDGGIKDSVEEDADAVLSRMEEASLMEEVEVEAAAAAADFALLALAKSNDVTDFILPLVDDAVRSSGGGESFDVMLSELCRSGAETEVTKVGVAAATGDAVAVDEEEGSLKFGSDFRLNLLNSDAALSWCSFLPDSISSFRNHDHGDDFLGFASLSLFFSFAAPLSSPCIFVPGPFARDDCSVSLFVAGPSEGGNALGDFCVLSVSFAGTANGNGTDPTSAMGDTDAMDARWVGELSSGIKVISPSGPTTTLPVVTPPGEPEMADDEDEECATGLFGSFCLSFGLGDNGGGRGSFVATLFSLINF